VAPTSPLDASVLAVADAFHEMMSDRARRPAVSHERAGDGRLGAGRDSTRGAS